MLGVVEHAAFGVLGQLDEPGFEVLDVGFVEALVVGGEEDAGGPEVFGVEVAFEAATDRGAFADVHGGQAAGFGGAGEEVDAGTVEFFPGFGGGEQGAGDHQAGSNPSGFGDDADAVGFAVGQIELEGVGAWYVDDGTA